MIARGRRGPAVVALTLTALVACARPPRAAPPAPAGGPWVYDVAFDGRALGINAVFPGTSCAGFALSDGAERFVRDVAFASGQGWVPARRHGEAFEPAGPLPECRLRYRFLLRDAARAFDEPTSAAAFGEALIAPLSTSLLRPRDEAARGYRLRIDPRAGTFEAGIASAAPDTYVVDEGSPADSPLATFGPWRRHTIELGPATIAVGIAPGARSLDDDAALRWVGEVARGVAAYYGSFPVRRLGLFVAGTSPGQIHGVTLGGGGATVLMRVGGDVDEARVRRDWTLTHELVHVGFASLGPPHQWLEEGLATYLEPVIRVRAGTLAVDAFWHDLLRDAPQGLPKPGDEGLERTHTWGRTYWGGAIFWLLADVRIRAETGGRRSLDDVVRGVVAAGGTVRTTWPVARVIEVGDRASATGVLRALYDASAERPFTPDLDALWRELGVARRAEAVMYDDAAPLAWVRRAITLGR